ncbi:hypothetical protein NRY95_10960 [Xanthomonas campestris pv. phormiicola]|nr:hypothetical protein [Xanthomonas campestris pv. phormiicola]UYC18427.1 hypothetical protein NRY95_10960 [Xanthomonas campestris pv. phormiicola]
MNATTIQRPNYFAGEALLTADFTCEQRYHMVMQSLNNQSLYTYGIASGLEVLWNQASTARQVEVRAGMALDSLGRQIVLLQPQVLRFDDVDASTSYFLTISYDEVYDDYSDETGVAGYKRIVEQPRLRYVRNLQRPGMDIVLAVVGFANDGAINALTYRSGNVARRYVGSTLGALTLVTEGAGVQGGAMRGMPANLADADDRRLYPRLSARKEGSAAQVYLEVDASRSQFMGLLTTRGNLGIGTDQPLANLQVDAITFKGQGALSSDALQVTLSQDAPSPFFQVGDVLISDPPITTQANGTTTIGVAQRRTIVTVDKLNRRVTVDRVFNPALQSISYTYIRSTLVRFSRNADTDLLRIGTDGTVALGMPASVNAALGEHGRSALMITPERRVGIALTNRDPAAALDVNGQIQADALVVGGSIRADSVIAGGAIQAQSFEGNGSKLQGLPILSYWTRETIGTPTSNLYYNEGNVGIRDKNPIASLSVGGGQSFIGLGLITSLSGSVLEGYQTAFADQVTVGDAITIGMLIEQIGIVSQVSDDTTLILQQQLPIAVSNSAYSYQPPGGDMQPGTGQISSNGTTLIGNGTRFTRDVAVGGRIAVARFDPANSVSQQCAVAAVASDTALTLKSAFPVDVTDSAYAIRVGTGAPTPGPGTISSHGLQLTGTGTQFSTLKPYARIVVPATATLRQTMLVKSVDSQTRLTLIQSDGNPLPSSSQLSAATSAYVVTPSVLAYMAANSDNGVLPPGDPVPPALIVVTNNLVDLPNTVAINLPLEQVQSRYALQVDGDVNFSGGSVNVDDLTVQTLLATRGIAVSGDGSRDELLTVGEAAAAPLLTVTKSSVEVATLHASGDVRSDTVVNAATLSGNALQVSGSQIASDGSVQIVGARKAYDQSALTNDGTTFSQQAHTDGYVMATIGQPVWHANYCGSLAGETFDGDQRTSFVYATGLAYLYTTSSGKKSSTVTRIPVPGAFTMPVRKGETWKLTRTWNKDFGAAPAVEFYWIPLGSPPAADQRTLGAAVSVPPGGGMAMQLQTLREGLASGRDIGTTAGALLSGVQQRVDDLTHVLGDAIHMSDDQGRQQFVQQLSKVVCAPNSPPQRAASAEYQSDVSALIDTLARILGHGGASPERELLAAGVHALIQINDNEDNRHDIDLIKRNIDLFIDNLQQSLQRQLDSGQRRLLTRALVRLVGDGSARLEH